MPFGRGGVEVQMRQCTARKLTLRLGLVREFHGSVEWEWEGGLSKLGLGARFYRASLGVPQVE